jgi:hypothetical protein
MKAQTKKDALLGVTAGLGALAGIGGLSTAFPDTDNTRIGLGVSSLIVGVTAALIAPFTASSVQNYADHCTVSGVPEAASEPVVDTDGTAP